MPRAYNLRTIERMTNPAYIPVWRIVGRKDVSFKFLKRLNKIIVHIEAKTKSEALEIFHERYGDHFDEYFVRRANPRKYYLYGRIKEVEVEDVLGDDFSIVDGDME